MVWKEFFYVKANLGADSCIRAKYENVPRNIQNFSEMDKAKNLIES